MTTKSITKFCDEVDVGVSKALSVKSCGREQCISSKIVIASCRLRYSLHLVTEGKGYLEHRSRKATLGAGDVFLLFAEEASKYYPDAVKPWSYMWIDFEGAGTEKFFSTIGITHEEPYLYVGKDRELITNFAQAVDAYDTMPGGTMLGCTGHFMLVLDRLSKLFGAEENYKPSKTIALVNSALTFVRNNYLFPLTVKDVAVSVKTNPDYLSAVFHQSTGQSLKNYITSLKMKYAGVLLRGGQYKVLEVAAKVGYKDPLYFSKVFTAHHKMAPSKYMSKYANQIKEK